MESLSDAAAPIAGATVSDCGRYRYTLERRWSAVARYVLWVMLNPSTADAFVDDATIRVCMGYARRWGYSGILVGNLYAWRATDPRDLLAAHKRGEDIVGAENAEHLEGLTRRAGIMVLAWGVPGPIRGTAQATLRALPASLTRHVLTLNKSGHPCHPLYKSAQLVPTEWHGSQRWGDVRVAR